MELTNISLFSGVGGMDLGAEAAGIETRAQVEINPFVETSSLLDSPMLYNSATSGKLRGGICSKPAEVAPQSYPAVSLVNPLASPETGKGQKTLAGYGLNISESYENLNPIGLLLKMLPHSSAFQSSQESTPILKRKVTKSGFSYYQLQTSERRTNGKDVLLLPTPTATDYKRARVSLSDCKRKSPGLPVFAAMLQDSESSPIGKTIHPRFAEWVMGFPENWTNPDYKQSVMQFVRGRYSLSMNVSQELKEI